MQLVYKAFIITVFITISKMNCYAQVKQVISAPNRSNVAAAQTYLGLGSLASSEETYAIEGTPYSTEAYVLGDVFLKQKVFEDIEMRYNIYSNRIEYKENGALMYLSPNNQILKVVMNNETLVINQFEVKGKLTPTYFVRLDSGAVTLLAKKNIGFRSQQLGKPIEGDVPAKYTQLPDEYFIKKLDGPLVRIQSIKKLIEYLPDHKAEMETFAKKEKISANKPAELTRFIQYYNSL
jgi:hypothetical protein